jgi:hypothetical protein
MPYVIQLFRQFGKRNIETNLFEIGSRPAGQCTCERAVTENKPVAGQACACGSRPQGEF